MKCPAQTTQTWLVVLASRKGIRCLELRGHRLGRGWGLGIQVGMGEFFGAVFEEGSHIASKGRRKLIERAVASTCVDPAWEIQ